MEYRTDDQVVPDIIWKDLKVVDLNLPYIPGLLAFREAHPVIDMIRHQMETSPEQTPDYLMIDGNGLVQDLNFRLGIQAKLQPSPFSLFLTCYILQNTFLDCLKHSSTWNSVTSLLEFKLCN